MTSRMAVQGKLVLFGVKDDIKVIPESKVPQSYRLNEKKIKAQKAREAEEEKKTSLPLEALGFSSMFGGHKKEKNKAVLVNNNKRALIGDGADNDNIVAADTPDPGGGCRVITECLRRGFRYGRLPSADDDYHGISTPHAGSRGTHGLSDHCEQEQEDGMFAALSIHCFTLRHKMESWVAPVTTTWSPAARMLAPSTCMTAG